MTEPRPIGIDPAELARPFPSTEVLTGKTEALVASLDSAMREGNLDPKLVRSLKSGAPRIHDDIILTYLGLKPATALVWYELDLHNEEFYAQGYLAQTYVKHFPTAAQGGTDIVIDLVPDDRADIASLWNQEAIEAVVASHPDVFIGEVDYTDPSFLAEELAYFQCNNTSPEEDLIFGLLLGFPRSAVEPFAEHCPQIIAICEVRQSKDTRFFNRESTRSPLGQIKYNENGARDRLTAFLEASEFRVDPALLNYISRMRPAEVPGFRFATTGPISEYEKQLTATWEASGVNAKLERLLVSHGV
ncbi:hypothetical protein A3F34_02900 [Candidatus Roizmanbacteria bacterium RIFCSPHIGHO2_12_FULL_44_10]|uniref:Uncharacterized protein n=1 Tax=Candidatus Roizmanbacteria bacterium RIFCSPHIGHO2_12_FULL_44_10 TaxID=1802054 RepID=A0A1F7I8Z1_9BACT|nr:MAG: hypothetical protein A3F34_02900 [Candidatus Roizmanbacteria bacterium RIFCSPHIGHO2_12_FULL_44_10]